MTWLFSRINKSRGVLVLGLDCASPDLVLYQLMDITPTSLNRMRMPFPPGMQGKVIGD